MYTRTASPKNPNAREFSEATYNIFTTRAADAALTTPNSRYAAYLVIDGRELRVFPPSKKTTNFRTITAASNLLERKARNNTFDARGLIVDAHTGIVVWSLAL